MDITYVGGQTVGRAGSTATSAVTFALTGGTNSTPQAGDLVVITSVKGSQGRNTAQAITTPTGYTHLGQLYANSTYDTSLEVSYKFMGETPDTSFTRPSTGNSQDAQRHTVQVFRDVDPSTPLDVTPVSATGTGTGRPIPGSITPTTTGAAILICGGSSAATGASYTAPSGFATGFLTGNTADTNDAMIGSGYQLGWTSGEVAPAQYGGGTVGNSADSWAAYTIALRPAPTAVAPTVTTNPTNQSTTVGNTATFTAEIDGDPTPDLQWEVFGQTEVPLTVSISSLTNSGSTTNGTSFATASISTTVDKPIIVRVISMGFDTSDRQAPTGITGAGLTFTKITDVDYGAYTNLSAWRAMPTSASSGALTIAYSLTQDIVSWDVLELTNADTSGTNGSGAIGGTATNTATGTTVTGAVTFGSSGATLAFHAFSDPNANTSATATPGSGFTEVTENQTTDSAWMVSGQTQFRSDSDTSADVTWSRSSPIGVIALEIVPALGDGWANVTGGSGATTGSYTTPTATIDMDGWEYRLKGTNSAGSVSTTAATLTVTAGGVTVDFNSVSISLSGRLFQKSYLQDIGSKSISFTGRSLNTFSVLEIAPIAFAITDRDVNTSLSQELSSKLFAFSSTSLSQVGDITEELLSSTFSISSTSFVSELLQGFGVTTLKFNTQQVQETRARVEEILSASFKTSSQSLTSSISQSFSSTTFLLSGNQIAQIGDVIRDLGIVEFKFDTTNISQPVVISSNDSINGIIFLKLRLSGYRGSLNDMLYDFFDNGGKEIKDRERFWLINQTGISIGSSQDLWMLYLTNLGYSGSFEDMLREFWINY